MKPFRRWIPRDDNRDQPRVMRLYFEDGSWVGFRRPTRAPRGSYERHRLAKGEVQFGQARYQFGGGLTEDEAGAILDELRAARIRFLVRGGHNESDLGEIACDDAIEFATNEDEQESWGAKRNAKRERKKREHDETLACLKRLQSERIAREQGGKRGSE